MGATGLLHVLSPNATGILIYLHVQQKKNKKKSSSFDVSRKACMHATHWAQCCTCIGLPFVLDSEMIFQPGIMSQLGRNEYLGWGGAAVGAGETATVAPAPPVLLRAAKP